MVSATAAGPRSPGRRRQWRDDGARAGPKPLSEEEIRSAVVDCGLYDAGERLGGRIELETALRKADACQDGFVWIGLHDPSAEVVEAVGRHFELHPLAVEDAVHAHQRAEARGYGDTLFLVLKTARYVDSEELVEIGEVMVFVGPRFVVTVRHGEGSPLHDVRLDLEAHPDLLGIGPSAVLYAVADRIVDDYVDGHRRHRRRHRGGRGRGLLGPAANPAERIYQLKREVLEFRRAVTPLVGADAAPGLRAGRAAARPAHRASTSATSTTTCCATPSGSRGFDELLTSALQANLAQITVRDNQDMRKISAWVAILAVPTMVFGLYGMNFEHMPELSWTYGYPAVHRPGARRLRRCSTASSSTPAGSERRRCPGRAAPQPPAERRLRGPGKSPRLASPSPGRACATWHMTRRVVGCARPGGRFSRRGPSMSVARETLPLSIGELQRTREPLERATALPQAAFTDPRVLDWELEHVFMGGWIGEAGDALRVAHQVILDVTEVVPRAGVERKSGLLGGQAMQRA